MIVYFILVHAYRENQKENAMLIKLLDFGLTVNKILQVDVCEFESSLVNIVSPRTARTT